MKFAWAPIVGVLLVTLVCAATADSPANDEPEDSAAKQPVPDETSEQEQLPILPPLILLDFSNDTDAHPSGDGKTKRTVNDNLGYGFQSNNLFAGSKLNYYFPSGKSGTTVSIEESISPFLPRTIVERAKPVTEKPESNTKAPEKTFSFRSQHFPPPLSHKTKLHASPAGSFDFQRFSSRPKSTVTSTQKPHYATSTPSSAYSGFFTQSPLFRQSPPSGSYSTQKPSYSLRATPSPYTDASFAPPAEATFNRYSPQKMATSTLNPVVSEQFYQPVKTLPPASHASQTVEKTVHPGDLNSYPKYTIENGVKYEHRIVWKYPDGRVSDDPPSSYVNSYSEYDSTRRPSSYSGNSDSSKTQGNFNYHSNLRYQGPVQFPKDSEPIFPKQTPFVKPASHSATNYQYFHNTPSKYSVPKLQVGTPNPEYLPPAGDSKGQDFTSGQLSPDLLSRYPSEAQKLLNKVLSPPKKEYDDDEVNDEVDTRSQYANLLNYNPSISQYIKNPSSILNAQPTFIQAGNSLIPVIILRVDGAPPVEQKPLSNINLKALLQQYISQYASSVSDLSRGTNYDFEDEELVKRYQDPHYDLKKLTDTLKQFSQQASSTRSSITDSATDSYGNALAAEFKSLADRRRNSNYRSSYKKPQKVKSVQIVEDPRFPNYKDSN